VLIAVHPHGDGAGIGLLLAGNPGLSLVAELDGAVVGAVLCGHDGRRALIYHLAVAASLRRRGIGVALSIATDRTV
jgi:ribosomal protein S18 acetylase RimI-like enzyme